MPRGKPNPPKPIEGFDGYFVDVSGAVFSERRGKLVQRKTHLVGGYERVNLRIDGVTKFRLVHRIVAQAFVKNRYNLPEVNHRDGDKLNNHAENLQWCDRSYNITHSYRVLGHKSPRSKSVRSLSTGIVFPSVVEAARVVGVDQSNISKAARGVQKRAANQRWEFFGEEV